MANYGKGQNGASTHCLLTTDYQNEQILLGTELEGRKEGRKEGREGGRKGGRKGKGRREGVMYIMSYKLSSV